MFLSKRLGVQAISLICAAGIFAAIAFAAQETRGAQEAEPTPPPQEIPAAPQPLIRPKLAYLAGGSTYNLSEEAFLRFLADFPKALLFRCPAKHISSDAKFHYYEDARFDRTWAFERAPEDNFFTKRAIWSRDMDDTDWQLVTNEATLAAPW